MKRGKGSKRGRQKRGRYDRQREREGKEIENSVGERTKGNVSSVILNAVAISRIRRESLENRRHQDCRSARGFGRIQLKYRRLTNAVPRAPLLTCATLHNAVRVRGCWAGIFAKRSREKSRVDEDFAKYICDNDRRYRYYRQAARSETFRKSLVHLSWPPATGFPSPFGHARVDARHCPEEFIAR
ncbi:hypothetical protein DBV15_01796 [Temnothorax longispinosus]|uniref:Uncharacterized protein n=1 Tax=Temnothorax longispinosus TaxID=300112 RepID=A0A4S2KMT7_9HYME|nr:hypothetical protein DBV15_01796 [Temnothorax longispinosus]